MPSTAHSAGNIDEIHDQYMAEDIVLKVPLNLADPAASGEAPFETQGRDEVGCAILHETLKGDQLQPDNLWLRHSSKSC